MVDEGRAPARMRWGLGAAASTRPRLIAGLAAMTVLVRLHAFLVPLTDGDVGLYYHIANGWLHGSLPYVRDWEYKPPGLFALFALAIAICGSFPLASAALSTLAVFTTALLLMELTVRIAPDQHRRVGIAAAVGFIFLSTEDQALAGDAELFIGPFVAAALLLLAPFDRRALPPSRFAWAGLAAGMALQMMLLAIPAVVVVAVLAALRAQSVKRFAAFAGAVVAPFALEAIVYARAGALREFIDANVAATLRRAHAHAFVPPDIARRALVAQARILGPLAELAPLSAFVGSNAGTLAVWAWLGAGVVAILEAAEFYDRHFLLLAPPIAILGALGAAALGRALRRPATVMTVVLVATFFMHDYFMARVSAVVVATRAFAHRDPIASEHYLRVRASVAARLRNDRSLYIVNESPLLYDDLRIPAPTRYPFAGDLLERGMWPMLGFRGIDELGRILAAKPHFILVGALRAADDPQTLALLRRRLRQDYRPVERFDTAVLYERRSSRSHGG